MHPRLILSPRLGRERLPTSLLDVLVHFDCEFVAALKAAAFEDIASVGRCHALAETMHAHAAADLGLIRSFNHSKIFLYFFKR